MQKAVRCLKRAAFFVDRRDAQYAPAECALDFGLAQSGNVLLSQVFPHVLDPPLAAHMGEPNQVPSSIMRKFIYNSGRTQSAQGRETCP